MIVFYSWLTFSIGNPLIIRINNTYEVDLRIKLLFDHPTIREQAMLVEEILIEQLNQLPDDAVLLETEEADAN
jgi:hypothetical protein